MKALRKFGILLALLLIATTVISNIVPQRALADTASLETDAQRVAVIQLKKCLDDGMIDKSDFSAAKDLLKGDSTKKDLVVGFILKPDNGVSTCAMAMAQGINVIGPLLHVTSTVVVTSPDAARDSLGNWLSQYFFNTTPANNASTTGSSNVQFDNAQYNAKIALINNQITSYLATAGNPSLAVIQSRFLSLLLTCYTPSTSVPNGLGSHDIALPNGGGFLLAKKTGDIKKTWNNLPDTNPHNGNLETAHVTIGDIELGWIYEPSVNPTGIGGDFDYDSDFWPIGTDMPAPYSNGHSGGFMQCSDIKNHPDLYSIYKAGDGELFNLDGSTVDTGTLPGSNDLSAGEVGHIDCEWSINPITWIMCPVVDLTQSVINTFDGYIQDALQLKVDYFDENGAANSPGVAYHKAWSAFRAIAISMLLLIGLIMVISQAVAFGPFDAYTIRRVMPRIAIAVIFITLSWPIMKTAVDLSNAMGLGVRAIIYEPFKSFHNPTLSGGTSTIGLIGSGALLGTLGILGVLSFLGTAALALLVGFIVITLRQVLVTMLTILAPIGILCFILPNTQKFWKMWHENFTRALLAFPIITAFIATGNVFSRIIGGASNPDTVDQILAFTILYAPFFMLPLAFRLAGGAVANIAGFANDKGKGGFDRLKKFRGNERKKIAKDTLEGNRLHGGRDGNRRGWMNTKLQRGAAIGAAGYSLNRATRRARINDRIGAINSAKQKAAGEDPAVQNINGDEDQILAGMYIGTDGTAGSDQSIREYFARRHTGTNGVRGDQTGLVDDGTGTGTMVMDPAIEAAAAASRAEFMAQTGHDREQQNQRVAAVRSAVRALTPQAYAGFAAVAAAGTGTGFAGGQGEMFTAINAAAGNDRQMASRLLNMARERAKGANRPDLYGTSFGASRDALNEQYEAEQLIQAQAERNATLDPTHTVAQHAEIMRQVAEQHTSEQMDDATLISQGAGAIATQRNNQLSRLAPRLVAQYNDAIARGDRDTATEVAAVITSFRSVMGSASTENRTVIANMLDQVGVRLDVDQSTDEQLGTQIVHATAATTANPTPPPATVVPARGPTHYVFGDIISHGVQNGKAAKGGELTAEGERVQRENAAVAAAERAAGNAVRARAGAYDSGTRGFDPNRTGAGAGGGGGGGGGAGGGAGGPP